MRQKSYRRLPADECIFKLETRQGPREFMPTTTGRSTSNCLWQHRRTNLNVASDLRLLDSHLSICWCISPWGCYCFFEISSSQINNRCPSLPSSNWVRSFSPPRKFNYQTAHCPSSVEQRSHASLMSWSCWSSLMEFKVFTHLAYMVFSSPAWWKWHVPWIAHLYDSWG